MVSIDYMFMEEKQKREEEKGMPILVMVDEKTGMRFASVVPQKGRDGYAIERLRRDLGLLGHKRLVLESDGEPAIKAFKEALKLVSGLAIAMEESPAGERQSNGRVEAAVRQGSRPG